MYKLILVLALSLFFSRTKEKKYIIVAGDITCKACVIELHHYLFKKVKKGTVQVALRDKGHFIVNESGMNYYRAELPEAQFVFLRETFFPRHEKYPYLLIIRRSDTLKLSYDSLFSTGHLSVKLLN